MESTRIVLREQSCMANRRKEGAIDWRESMAPVYAKKNGSSENGEAEERLEADDRRIGDESTGRPDGSSDDIDALHFKGVAGRVRHRPPAAIQVENDQVRSIAKPMAVGWSAAADVVGFFWL